MVRWKYARHSAALVMSSLSTADRARVKLLVRLDRGSFFRDKEEFVRFYVEQGFALFPLNGKIPAKGQKVACALMSAWALDINEIYPQGEPKK